MSLLTSIHEVRQIFLDTAPIIYFTEANPQFAPILRALFEKLDRGEMTAVVSPITLAECLVLPYKTGKPEAAQVFIDLLVNNNSVWFYPIEETIAERAAELRARYKLTLVDAFQVAMAINTRCDAFLTNDKDLKRIKEIPIVIINE